MLNFAFRLLSGRFGSLAVSFVLVLPVLLLLGLLYQEAKARKYQGELLDAEAREFRADVQAKAARRVVDRQNDAILRLQTAARIESAQAATAASEVVRESNQAREQILVDENSGPEVMNKWLNGLF